MSHVEEYDVLNILVDLNGLHAHKARAYGASWRRHGEYLSIFANITRKVDRLLYGGPPTPDESQTDTIADLAVYATLYVSWLSDTTDELDEGFYDAGQEVISQAVLLSANTFETLERIRQIYDELETIILAETRGHVITPRYKKRMLVARLAAVCVLWLLVRQREHPPLYAAWASPWRKAVTDA